MLMISGTVPFDNIGVVAGSAELIDGSIMVADQSFPVNRGTAALMATACIVSRYVGLSSRFCGIADILEIPQGTVMSRLHRARVALAKAYRACDD